MEIETLFGLPAHPLVVHAAVVLLPIAAIGLIVIAFVAKARRAYAPVILGLALLATFAVGLAQGSGEALEERVDETALVEEHTERGETVLPWAIGVTVMAALVTFADPIGRRVRSMPSAKVVTGVLVVGALVTAIGATVAIIDVGHSGAKATWDDPDR